MFDVSSNLVGHLARNVAKYPEAVALQMGEVSLTYAELWTRIKVVAAQLRSNGVQRGDKVALLLPNTMLFPISYYSVLSLGAIVIPINPALTASEIRHILLDSNSRLAIVLTRFADTVYKALSCSTLATKVVPVTAVMQELGWSGWNTPVSSVSFEDELPETVDVSPDEVAVIMYTGAYEGTPLGAQLTHSNLACNARTIGEYDPSDRCLIVLPLFHSFAQTVLMNAALFRGACIILIAGFDARSVLEQIAAFQVTVIGLVPTMVQLLTLASGDWNFDCTTLRVAVVGGAPISSEAKRSFKAKFGPILLEGYGLTEASPVVTFNTKSGGASPNSVGLPIPGCEVRIVDSLGEEMSAGSIGEVIVRGHNVMKGYLNQPEATARALREGWLYTGDLGFLDEDGYLYLRGMKKNMLIRAGMNVYPREVEQVLELHPEVKSAQVAAIPDTLRGQEVKAIIKVSRVSEKLQYELTSWCRERLAPYKCPRYFCLEEW